MWDWLNALPAFAAMARAIASLFGKKIDADERAKERHAGATEAAFETAADTAEIADAQGRLNAEHPDLLALVDELRASAAKAGRASGNSSDGGKHG